MTRQHVDTDAPRRPTGRAEGRAADIREAALTLFAERGYHGTSMKDLGELLGIRAPSLYNHVVSKQEILRAVMVETMEDLLAEHRDALGSTDDVVDRLRRATEAHVRYHARHPREVGVGNREIPSLEEPAHTTVVELRSAYARSWRQLIEHGVRERRFEVPSPQLAAYAILEMGIGVARWYRDDGPLSEAIVAYHYGDMALRVVGARASDGTPVFPVAAEGRRGRARRA